jgi:tetratricopeptide (TPR) repeat protein
MKIAFHWGVLLLCLFPGSGLLLSAGAGEHEIRQDTISLEEQEKKVEELLEKVLRAERQKDIQSILAQKVGAYEEIIFRYPESSRTPETYWRLMVILLKRYNPPDFEKAESLYNDFKKKYSDPQMIKLISEDLSDAYYSNGEWERMLKLQTPAIKKFIETGTLSTAAEMFLYSEAKLNLGDLIEAVKGYKIVVALFPHTEESSKSIERLKEIKEKYQKNNN